MAHIEIRRYSCRLVPDSARVLLRPYLPALNLIHNIIDRVLSLDQPTVSRELQLLYDDFATRHTYLEDKLVAHYHLVSAAIEDESTLNHSRQLLIGAHFSGEYALESAALFNPSMVRHPDQTGLQPEATRFMMSLRATGEGHISSIEFRSGVLSGADGITIDPVDRFVSTPQIAPTPMYHKPSFSAKLSEIDCDQLVSARVMASLNGRFSRHQLQQVLDGLTHGNSAPGPALHHTLTSIEYLADSNYEIRFDPQLHANERVIFPISENESNGIEDARFVEFTHADGSVMYYATYTAFNGYTILPQLMATEDFLNFRFLTLNGNAVQNKGMALFPRQINGHYVMLSRQDDENISIMFSDNLHFWNDRHIILRPHYQWESVKIGNCGSPLETAAGWLIITHGVGAMRTYCIGAALLDLNDPTRVIGRLREPLLRPHGLGREGYVPNVVYSCGSILHGDDLILPFAMSDRETAIASTHLHTLLDALQSRPNRVDQ